MLHVFAGLDPSVLGKKNAQGIEYDPGSQAEGCTQDQGHSFFLIQTGQGWKKMRLLFFN